jgi:hypothetical protein
VARTEYTPFMGTARFSYDSSWHATPQRSTGLPERPRESGLPHMRLCAGMPRAIMELTLVDRDH